MGGCKLSREQVLKLRGMTSRIDLEATSRVWGVHPHTIRRALQGKTWADDKRIGRSPDEAKACVLCGKEFSRRFANGRFRTAALWERKKTCSHSCAMVMSWRSGAYKNRKR
jgi:hypothetical protein